MANSSPSAVNPTREPPSSHRAAATRVRSTPSLRSARSRSRHAVTTPLLEMRSTRRGPGGDSEAGGPDAFVVGRITRRIVLGAIRTDGPEPGLLTWILPPTVVFGRWLSDAA